MLFGVLGPMAVYLLVAARWSMPQRIEGVVMMLVIGLGMGRFYRERDRRRDIAGDLLERLRDEERITFAEAETLRACLRDGR
jgi:hypothetical protein